MIRKIISTVLLLVLSVTYHASSQNISKKKEIKNTNLKKGYNYSSFTSNKKYLAWAEFYTMQIFIYDLEKDTIKTVIQKKGRGPNEYAMISSLTLTGNNKLIITDPENIKFITYDIEASNYEKDINFDNVRPYRTVFQKDFLFFTTIPINFESLYHVFNMNSSEQSTIEMKNLNSNEFTYPYKSEGYITANDSYGIHLANYYPNIYVIDLQKKQVQNRIVFDQVETKKGGMKTVKGKKAFSHPKDVEIESEDVAFLPESDHSILILAEGKGEQRSYDPSQLRVYNFIEEKFTNILDLGVRATKLMVNSNYLFVYSEEENAIFQYIIQDG